MRGVGACSMVATVLQNGDAHSVTQCRSSGGRANIHSAYSNRVGWKSRVGCGVSLVNLNQGLVT